MVNNSHDGCVPPVLEERLLRKDAQENRERLLKSAGELFALRGIDVTLDDVARHAGLGVGTVYRRFANKECLIEALFESRMEELVGVVSPALDFDDPWEGFVFLLEHLLSIESLDKGLRDLLLSTNHNASRFDFSRDRLAIVVRAVVARAIEAGSLRADFDALDIPIIAVMIGAINDYVDDSRSDLWRRYLSFILDGLRQGADDGRELDIPPLKEDQLITAMQCWKRRPLR